MRHAKIKTTALATFWRHRDDYVVERDPFFSGEIFDTRASLLHCY